LLFEVVKLGLEGGVLVGVQLGLFDTSGGAFTNTAHDSLAHASLDNRASKKARFHMVLIDVSYLLDICIG